MIPPPGLEALLLVWMPAVPMLPNDQVARRLEEVADLLKAQGANPYRVHAYRRAAAALQIPANADLGDL